MNISDEQLGRILDDLSVYRQDYHAIDAKLDETIKAFRDFKKKTECLRAENARFRDALEAIASCKSIIEGDVVDIARKALREGKSS